MRCRASGAPSPARRTVPLIQKPPLPIRSTIGAPLRWLLEPPDIEGVGARPCARAGNRKPETPLARAQPPVVRRLRRLSRKLVIWLSPPGDRAVAAPSGQQQGKRPRT